MWAQDRQRFSTPSDFPCGAVADCAVRSASTGPQTLVPPRCPDPRRPPRRVAGFGSQAPHHRQAAAKHRPPPSACAPGLCGLPAHARSLGLSARAAATATAPSVLTLPPLPAGRSASTPGRGLDRGALQCVAPRRERRARRTSAVGGEAQSRRSRLPRVSPLESGQRETQGFGLTHRNRGRGGGFGLAADRFICCEMCGSPEAYPRGAPRLAFDGGPAP